MYPEHTILLYCILCACVYLDVLFFALLRKLWERWIFRISRFSAILALNSIHHYHGSKWKCGFKKCSTHENGEQRTKKHVWLSEYRLYIFERFHSQTWNLQIELVVLWCDSDLAILKGQRISCGKFNRNYSRFMDLFALVLDFQCFRSVTFYYLLSCVFTSLLFWTTYHVD